MADELARYLDVLRAGGIVACPTETFFGLLVDAHNHHAVERLVLLKGREASNPVALLVPNVSTAETVAESLTPHARTLADRFWPGPLTLVVRARSGLSPLLVKDGRVGMRVPGESVALDLVRAFGSPLTATSANKSGEPPARTSDEVAAAFGTNVDAIVPGRAPGGAPSTVLDVTVSPPLVLRAGAIHIDSVV